METILFKPYNQFIKRQGGKTVSLGNSLFQARKKCGLSQEDVAEKLGVSRQTVSKWETDETVPDIRQSKKMDCNINSFFYYSASFSPLSYKVFLEKRSYSTNFYACNLPYCRIFGNI